MAKEEVRSDHESEEDRMSRLETRLRLTLRHTRVAVFNTSFTTMLAFIATGLTPLMPISSFGIFSALTIFLNFVFCLTITPCAVLLVESGACGCGCRSSCGTFSSAERSPSVVGNFLLDYYAPILQKKQFSAFILIACIGIAVGFGLKACQLETPVSEEQWFPVDHMMEGLNDYMQQSFSTGEEGLYQKVSVVYGISGMDRPDYSRWTPDKNGAQFIGIVLSI